MTSDTFNNYWFAQLITYIPLINSQIYYFYMSITYRRFLVTLHGIIIISGNNPTFEAGTQTIHDPQHSVPQQNIKFLIPVDTFNKSFTSSADSFGPTTTDIQANYFSLSPSALFSLISGRMQFLIFPFSAFSLFCFAFLFLPVT